MHPFVSAHDGVDRTDIEALPAADAKVFHDFRAGAWRW
jgi:hypothetical protein